MECPKCGCQLELKAKENSLQEMQRAAISQFNLPQEPVKIIQQVPQPEAKKNKITDDEFLNAQRILSLAAQGKR